MNDAELLAMLRDTGALRFGRFTLASGRESDYYVDVKQASRPEVLRAVAERMAPHVRGYDRVAGVELGAVPIATAVSLETGIPYVLVRRAEKAHGTRRGFEGEMSSGDRVVFVEDVVTTAGTLSSAVERLRQAGAVVDRAVTVVDREEGGSDALSRIGVTLLSLFTARDVRNLGETAK